nr:hypothetical protein [Tanacetum cinerariifolium]
TTADVNVNALAGQAPTMAPPMRTDDQILPHIRWVPIGKSNYYLDVEKSQSNPIYKIDITPVNNNQAFTSPPSSDALINYVNELGYPKLHKFHPRPDSLLYMPNEEPVLRYLKFIAKGTKREVFGMPIHGSLITTDIQEASYYQEYLAKVAMHQRYLASETWSDPDSPTSKPTKTARKPKPIAPKADPRPSVSKPVSTKQPEPKSALAKTQGKKCKLTIEISDKLSKAMKSRPGLVSKKRKPLSSLRFVDESVAEDVPAKEPQVDDEEADVQRALEESVKNMYAVPWGPLLPVVIREPESGKYQPLPEKNPADRYIFHRRTSTPTGSSGNDESSSLYVGLGLIDSKEESKEDVPRVDARGQGEGHAGSDPVTNLQKPIMTKQLQKPKPESMVSVTIQQDMSSIPLMTTPRIDLTSRLESPKVHQLLKAIAIETSTTTAIILPPPSQQQQSIANAMMMKRISEIEHIMANLIQENKRLEHETDSYKSHEDHMQLYEALEKLMNRDHSEELIKDLAKARPSEASGSPGASGSSQVPPPPPPPPSTNQENLQMDEDMAPDEQAQSSNDEYIGNAHIPKTGNIAMFIDRFCKRRGITELKPQYMEGPAFEIIKVFYPDKTITTGSPPGQVPIQSDFFLNKDLEYLRYGSKGSRPALSISKMKAAYYPDVGLEQMVHDQMWIEDECKYDIAAMYGISHWWAIMFRDRYGVQMIMRFNEIYKFSNGTLQQIDEALDYRVKEFKINRMNPGLNTKFWTRKDADRSKEFMFTIQKRLKTRRIFRNLESFVGGCVRDGDYILLKRTE